MSRLLLIVLVLFLLAAGAVLLVPVLLDKDQVLQLAATTLRESTGATLAVDGDAELAVFPTPGIALSDAAVTIPGDRPTDVRIGSLRLGVQFLPLLRRHVEIDTIELAGVRARITTGPAKARTDSTTLSDQDLDALSEIRRQRMAASAQAAGAALTAQLVLHVRQLSVTDARVELLDPGGAVSMVIDVNFKGGLQLNQQQQTAALEHVDATVSGLLASPVRLHSSGTIDLGRQGADLKLALELGEARGDGTLRYSGFESPQVDTVLHFNTWNPALLALAAPDALAAPAQQPASPNGDKALPLDTLRAIDARTDITIDTAQFDAHTVHNLRVQLRALDGLVQVTELTGSLYGGTLQASATLDGRHNNVTLDTSGNLSHLDIAAALAATAAKPVLTGRASLDWQLHSNGQSTAALAAALRGPLKLTTEDVVLTGLSVEKLLCQAVALSNKEALTAPFPADTRFTTLAADIHVESGKAVIKPLHAALPQVTLAGSGNYDLLQKTFAANLQARLLPELEQLDHACRVSKRLAAIDLPVNCAGTVGTAPATWCSVDAAKIVQDLGVNEVREKLGKEAGKLFNKLFGKGTH